MSKKTTPAAKATTPTTTGERLDAFTVRDYEQAGEKKADWNKIGAAWPHSDRQGFRVVLTALPVDGVIVLRKAEVKDAE